MARDSRYTDTDLAAHINVERKLAPAESDASVVSFLEPQTRAVEFEGREKRKVGQPMRVFLFHSCSSLERGREAANKLGMRVKM